MGSVFATCGQESCCGEFPTQLAKVPGKKRNLVKNPGTLQDINKRTKELSPILFEGAKIIACKNITDSINIKHTFHLSSVTPSGYRFGLSYCGDEKDALSRCHHNCDAPLIYTEVSPAGDVSAILSTYITSSIACRAFTQIHRKKEVNESSIFFDYLGPTYTLSAYACDVNHLYESGSILFHYLQSLTGRIALGTEFTLRWDRVKKEDQFSMLSLAARYCSPDNMICATISPNALDFYYYQRANGRLHVGSELSINLRTSKSTAAILYKLNLEAACFKGIITSDWNVGATVEKCLCQLPITLVFSGLLNHNNGQFRMGIGLQTD